MPCSSPGALERIWLACLPNQCSPVAVSRAFAEIVQHYSSPLRHYHNLDHIRHVVQIVQQLAPHPTVLLAALLHDVIYDPHRNDNEERSAEYARTLLTSLGLDAVSATELARLILLTKTHTVDPDDALGVALLDADLSILGASESEYDAYSEAIRCEYSWVAENDYRTGRRRVLERFLARSWIFHSATLRVRLECSARSNLRREIALLLQ